MWRLEWSDMCEKAKQVCVTCCVVKGVSTSVVREGGFYGRLFLSRVSKIAFRKMVWSSFKWLLSIDSAWM